MGRINPDEEYRPNTTGFDMAAICHCLYEIKGYVAVEEARAVGALILADVRGGVPPVASMNAGITDWRRRTGKTAKASPVRVQNGIPMPKPGKCLAVWLDADELRITGMDYPMIRKTLMSEAEQRGHNHGNVSVEVSRWRTFHDLPKKGFAQD